MEGSLQVGLQKKSCASVIDSYSIAMNISTQLESVKLGNGIIHHGDVLNVLNEYDENQFQLIIADPPYFQVLLEHEWDNIWKNEQEYLDWTREWVKSCKRVLRHDGLLYIFGQLGKREHIWLHVCSMLASDMQFHDM